jgi:hypothetical protein
MAKKKKQSAEMTDKQLARQLFSKSVRKKLKAALSEGDDNKPKRKSAARTTR